MISHLTSIGAILASTVFFLMGNGLMGTLAPVRAHLDGFSSLALGLMGTGFFAGFAAGCFAGPLLMARSGHIRTFSVAASLTAVSVLALPILVTPFAWFALRAVAGLGIAILFTVIESWLNDRAGNNNRGNILSLYVVVNLVSLIMGQWLFLLGSPLSFELFTIGAMAYCLCLMPVAVTQLPQPAAPPVPRLNLRVLFARAPVGAAGCMTVGIANGAFWTLAPVYAQGLGFGSGDLALFMTVFIAGGALVQWPVGQISDGVDRRWVIAALCTLAAGCGLALGFTGWYLLRVPLVFFALVFTLGAAMLPLYSLSIAHANDRLPRAEFVQTSAGLLMITALLSIPGPLLAATVMSLAGPYALFLFTAIAHAAMAFFAFTRIRMREAPPPESRDEFAAMVPGSPAAAALDPRA